MLNGEIKVGRMTSDLLAQSFDLEEKRFFWPEVAESDEPPEKRSIAHYRVEFTRRIVSPHRISPTRERFGEQFAKAECQLGLKAATITTDQLEEDVVRLLDAFPRCREAALPRSKRTARKERVDERRHTLVPASR
jgi:hypothetical protein